MSADLSAETTQALVARVRAGVAAITVGADAALAELQRRLERAELALIIDPAPLDPATLAGLKAQPIDPEDTALDEWLKRAKEAEALVVELREALDALLSQTEPIAHRRKDPCGRPGCFYCRARAALAKTEGTGE